MINDSIEVKGIIWEDMVNYKKISTTLMMPRCNFKCDKEYGSVICQNSELAAAPSQTVLIREFMRKYRDNPIPEAIVLQGLEPLDSLIDVYTVAAAFNHYRLYDDLVIYTGYNKDEISTPIIQNLRKLIPGQLIIKWGRYIPNQEKHFDPVLGVYLASDNQYGEIIKL